MCLDFFSLTSVLTLALIGAGGRTAAQIRDVLYIPCNKELQYLTAVKTVSDQLNGNDGSKDDFSLETASKVSSKSQLTVILRIHDWLYI